MFRFSDFKVESFLQRYTIHGQIRYLGNHDLKLRYLVINDHSNLPTLCFIHGAPGGVMDFRQYLKLDKIHQNFRIIALERPGYGFSRYGKPVTSIIKQAGLLAKILNEEHKGPLCLVGHSFGGPVAAKIAVDHPELVQHLVLLAPALDPSLEKTFYAAYLTKIPELRGLIPAFLKVAAAEKFAHEAELNKIFPDWQNLKVPTTYFHGTNDWIVPYANIHFAARHFKLEPKDLITMKGVNHFINYFPRKVIINQLLHWKASCSC